MNSCLYYQIPDFTPSTQLQATMREIQNTINHLNTRRDSGLSPVLKERIFKYLKVSHVYNSNAIEGNLLSLRETELILDNMSVNEQSFKDQVEARSLGLALEYLHGLINGKEPLCKDSLITIHNLLMAEIPLVAAGQLRKENVSISQSSHTPPKWEYVLDHLNDLFKWFEREKSISPIVKGAILHHWLTWIHPFQDGNGRVSRLMLNFHMLQHGFPEIVIRIEDRDRYYNALSAADQGDITALVDLCCDKLFETAAIYDEFINEGIRESEWVKKYTQTGFEKRIETARYDYEVWKSAMEVFRTRFAQTVRAIEPSLRDLSFTLRFYPVISFNQYLDILEDRKLSQTWFFKLVVCDRGGNETAFIFYFGRWRIPKVQNMRPFVKLFISVQQGGHSRKLSDNINLVNIGLMKDRLVIGLREPSFRQRVVSVESLPGPIIRDFIDQILKEYYDVG
ncbi:MAG: Fic family protein [Negativicutes bacterium]|nr:Fic family protein [Negativicutes bacterium]